MEEQPERGAERSVKDRELPVLLVVNLSVTGQHGRNPADFRQRHRIAHQPPPFLAPHRVRRKRQRVGRQHPRQCGEGERIDRLRPQQERKGVGGDEPCALRQQRIEGRRIGRREGVRAQQQRIGHRKQAVTPHGSAERVGFGDEAAADDRAHSPAALGRNRSGCRGQQQDSGPQEQFSATSHTRLPCNAQARLSKRSMNFSISASSEKPMTILPPPFFARLMLISGVKKRSSCSTSRM